MGTKISSPESRAPGITKWMCVICWAAAFALYVVGLVLKSPEAIGLACTVALAGVVATIMFLIVLSAE
jgi:hypothetical protein